MLTKKYANCKKFAVTGSKKNEILGYEKMDP